MHWWEQGFYTGGGPKGFTGLHGAAFLVIGETLTSLLVVKGWDIKATDGLGRTALAWAALGGHEDIVKMLLQRKDVNPDATNTICGRIPLRLAVDGGHEGVVKLLLERDDINPITEVTGYDQTPF